MQTSLLQIQPKSDKISLLPPALLRAIRADN
jgi:hypothetical protein